MPRPAFELDLLVPGPPEQVWGRLWDLGRHTAAIPLTTVATTRASLDADAPADRARGDDAGPDLAPGTSFTARTALGPFALDDDMVVRAWDPPRHAVIDKVGRVLTGTIEVDLRPAGKDTRLHWAQAFGATLGTARVPDALAGLAAGPVRTAYRRALQRIARP